MTESIDLTKARARADYEKLLKLLGTFTRTKHLLSMLEARANQHLTKLAGQHAHKFATLQTRATEAESDIRAIAEKHPEWFPENQRTLKTLFGSVHAQKTTKHIPTDDEATVIAVIEREIALARDRGLTEEARTLASFITTTKTLDLAAVAKADETRLNEVGIDRVVEDSITVKEAKVSLGNAVKKGAKKKVEKGSEVPA